MAVLRISPSILHKGAEQIMNISGSSASLTCGETFICRLLQKETTEHYNTKKKYNFNQVQSFLTIVRHSEIESYAGNCHSSRVSLATQFSETRYLYVIKKERPSSFHLLRKLVLGTVHTVL